MRTMKSFFKIALIKLKVQRNFRFCVKYFTTPENQGDTLTLRLKMDYYFQNHLFNRPEIAEAPSKNLGIIITIPSFNEPHLQATLNSLQQCLVPNTDVEVIVHVNSSEASAEEILEQNQATIKQYLDWTANNKQNIKYHLIRS